MEKNFAASAENIENYLESLIHPEDSVLNETRRYTQAQGLPAIQVGAFDARHLEVIAAATGALRAVEIGTLGGYSGISLLRGMNQGNTTKNEKPHLYTFDADPKHLKVAAENFKHAGLSSQVSFFEGPALEQLKKIEPNAPFDLVFIDADKVNYPHYLQWAEKHLRFGGVLLADNVFGWNYITSDSFPSKDIQESVFALRNFNKQLSQSPHFFTTFLPTGEGLAMAIKIMKRRAEL